MLKKILGYKHIIWDWNGTLLNDAWLSVDIINEMLKNRGLPEINHSKYRELFDFPVYDYYERLGMDYNKEPFERISNEFTVRYNKRWHECRLQEGAREVLDALKASGIDQSVLSAAHIDILEKCVSHFGIKDYFVELIGLDHHHADSKIEKGKQWVSKLALDPEYIVLIGDTVHDFEVASALGVNCILVSHGHHSLEKLKPCKAEIVNSLYDIIGG